jgi:hypothetical protein
VLAFAPAAEAATLYVPGQFPDLASAYQAANAGDVIELAAGSHRAQVVPRGAKAVTFRGAPGAEVHSLDNSASNVTFQGIGVDVGFAKDSGFENHGADNVTFRDAAIGNVADEKAAVVSGSHFTFDNVLFHDAVMTAAGEAAGVHMECVYAIVVPRFTVRNSTFRDCAVMDLFFTYGNWWDPLPPPYGNVTVENNVFMHPEMDSSSGWHYYGLYVYLTANGGGRFDGWVVRNNTFENDARVEPSSGSNSRWVGNVGTWDCVDGVVYRRNVGKRCGASDKVVSPARSTATSTAAFGWVDPARGDFRLKAGSPAIDAGDPADAPARDRAGLVRDAKPDAGAHEFGASPSPPPSAPAPGPDPGGGSGQDGGRQVVLTARLNRRTICKRARRGCARRAVLRLTSNVNTKVAVRVLKQRQGRAPKLRRKLSVRVHATKRVVIRARRLPAGRYSVAALAKDGGHRVSARQGVKLRVRR